MMSHNSLDNEMWMTVHREKKVQKVLFVQWKIPEFSKLYLSVSIGVNV